MTQKIECKICNRVFKNYMALSAHIYPKHKISSQKYYDIYIDPNDSICYCGNIKTRFDGINSGYRKFCSNSCYANDQTVKEKHIQFFKGRKQTKKQIEKRIKNTNQKNKEQTRQTTMLKKYGKLSLGGGKKGTKRLRTKKHQDKIIESKKRNGTLNHNKTTKSKISTALNYYWQNTEDPSITLSTNNGGRGHKHGYYKNIYYRSSYELIFILFAEHNNILIESAENKTYRVKYRYKGKYKWYYPDFYIPSLNVLVEIKPKTMITDQVKAKILATKNSYNILLLVEDQLFNDKALIEIFIKKKYNLSHNITT